MGPVAAVSNGISTWASGEGAYMARIQMESRPRSRVQGSVPRFVIRFTVSKATHFEPPGHLGVRQELDPALHLDGEAGPRVVREGHGAEEDHMIGRGLLDLPGPLLQRGRGLPLGKEERLAGGEVQA